MIILFIFIDLYSYLHPPPQKKLQITKSIVKLPDSVILHHLCVLSCLIFESANKSNIYIKKIPQLSYLLLLLR